MISVFRRNVGTIFLTVGLMMLPVGIASARTFFLNAVNGNDGNTGIGAETAWKSLSRANSAFAARTVQAGDTVAFRRGDTFTGSLTLDTSGKTGRPLVIGAYGTGPAPVIDASTTTAAS